MAKYWVMSIGPAGGPVVRLKEFEADDDQAAWKIFKQIASKAPYQENTLDLARLVERQQKPSIYKVTYFRGFIGRNEDRLLSQGDASVVMEGEITLREDESLKQACERFMKSLLSIQPAQGGRFGYRITEVSSVIQNERCERIPEYIWKGS